jgi:uncharacterized protein YjbI with pentapeptide repeats
MPDHSQTVMTLVIGISLLMIVGWLAGWISQRGLVQMKGWLDRLGERFGALNSVGAALLILLAFGWLALFGVTVAATFGGVMALQADPGSGGLGLGAVLIGLLGAPFLIWNTVIKQTTLNFQKEGHITDRISKAVEQLGTEKTVKVRTKDTKGNDITIEETKPNIEVRIGAILSLERIAQDSTGYDNGRDHVRVMEILCAYVRENAPASGAKSGPTAELKGQNDLDAKLATSSAVRQWAHELKSPRLDITVALKVIGRRTQSQRTVEKNYFSSVTKRYQPDLSHTNLQKADLEGLDFSGSNFFYSRLEASYGNDASFADCNFIYSDLTSMFSARADFSKSRLDKADLSFAVLDHANFSKCRFSHTHFVASQLHDSKFEFLAPKKPGTLQVNSVFFIRSDLRNTFFSGWLASGIIIDFGGGEEATKQARYRFSGVAFQNAVLATEAWNDWHTFGVSEDLKGTFGDGSSELGPLERPANWPVAVLQSHGPNSFDAELVKWRADSLGYAPP